MQAVGVKRKREELDQDQPLKKSKIMDTLCGLPDDCWQNICGYLSLESASALYFVSKSFKRLHALFLASYFNRVHGLPTDVVPFLPASVARATSNIDVTLLFEKAVYLAETKNYVELAETLKKLLYRAEMVAVTNSVRTIAPQNCRDLIDEKHLKSVCYSDFCRKIESVWEDSDSNTCNTTQKSAFIWVGKDRRYIAVKCEYHDLYTHGDGQGWLNFKVTVVLKQLGVDNNNETIVFEFKKDPKNTDGTHEIKECIFGNDKYEQKEYFNEEDIRKIMDWLKVDLIGENSSKNFMEVLLNLAVSQRSTLRNEDENAKFDEYDEDYLDEEQIDELAENYNNEINLNGDMAMEISKLMQFYLSGMTPQGSVFSWAFKARFVLKRLLRKLAFIQCINNLAKISSDDAKNELIDLFARAKMGGCSAKFARFEVPKTRYSKLKPCFSNKQSLELILHPNPEKSFSFGIEVCYEGSPGDFSSEFSVDLCILPAGTCRSFNFESAVQCKKRFYRDQFNELIQEMNLQHATENDWLELILAYMEPPGPADMKFEADYHNDEDDNEDEE